MPPLGLIALLIRRVQLLPEAQRFVPLASQDVKMRDDISGLNRDNKCFEEENIMKKEEIVALWLDER